MTRARCQGLGIQNHLSDIHNTSQVTLDETGSWCNREEYSPFGESLFGGFAKKRYRFTGKERDEESGFSYHGARYYASWMCRWASADPAGLADGLNRYLYARGSPIRLMDGTGLEGEESAGMCYANGSTPELDTVSEAGKYDQEQWEATIAADARVEIDAKGRVGPSSQLDAYTSREKTLRQMKTHENVGGGLVSATLYNVADAITDNESVLAAASDAGAMVDRLIEGAYFRPKLPELQPPDWAKHSELVGTADAGYAGGLGAGTGRGSNAVVSETRGAVTNLGSRAVAENTELFGRLPSGEGMSGVFDHATGSFVLRHSTTASPLPGGSVARYGGHLAVRGDLAAALGEDLSSAASGRLSGFSVSKQVDGGIQFGWNSGQINIRSHGTRSVPTDIQVKIEASVRAALGLH